MTRSVRYSSNGDLDRLEIVDDTLPEVGPGQVKVDVRAAGLNPVDWKILSGGMGEVSGSAGIGADFSGVVAEVGEGVSDFNPGDLVFGGLPHRSIAEQLLIEDPENRLDLIPRGLGLDAAGGLYIAGRTAVAGIRAIAPQEGETVYVSGASGGVGIIAAQLAVNLGARVIGSASDANLGLLASLGIVPIAYGDGLAERLRAAAPEGIHAAFSTQGTEGIEELLALGVPAERIDSIGAGPQVADTHGVHIDGETHARREDLAWLGKAIAYGHVHLPVARVFAFDEVQEAYRFLQTQHPAGKVVLRIAATPLSAEQRGHLNG